MKKIAIIALAIMSQTFFAQKSRFIYQVTMKPDSTNLTNIKTENAYLDTDGKKSIFYAENTMKRDSLFGRMRQTGSFNFDRTQMESLRSNIDFIIEKDFKTGAKIFKSRIARDQYSYDEDRTMEWKILPETAKIGDYKTQKAETNFGGRTWYAWFTMDVPFQDGPYKFSGLPGLIVKAEDAKGDYSFDLKETKKIPETADFQQRGSVITLKREDYTKQWEKYRKDPESFMNQGRNFGGGNRGGNSGGFQPNQQQMKEMRERIKKEIQSSNNPIELK